MVWVSGTYIGQVSDPILNTVVFTEHVVPNRRYWVHEWSCWSWTAGGFWAETNTPRRALDRQKQYDFPSPWDLKHNCILSLKGLIRVSENLIRKMHKIEGMKLGEAISGWRRARKKLSRRCGCGLGFLWGLEEWEWRTEWGWGSEKKEEEVKEEERGEFGHYLCHGSGADQ